MASPASGSPGSMKVYLASPSARPLFNYIVQEFGYEFWDNKNDCDIIVAPDQGRAREEEAALNLLLRMLHVRAGGGTSSTFKKGTKNGAATTPSPAAGPPLLPSGIARFAALRNIPQSISSSSASPASPSPTTSAPAAGPFVKVTKIPGMADVCEKVRFHRLLQVVKPFFDREGLDLFVPDTYILPDQAALARRDCRDSAKSGSLKQTLIVKPEFGTQGHGIFLCRTLSELNQHIDKFYNTSNYYSGGSSSLTGIAMGNLGTNSANSAAYNAFLASCTGPSATSYSHQSPTTNSPILTSSSSSYYNSSNRKSVAQAYVENPLLLDGLKFDLRLYVVITEITPHLKALLYREGLARFCTTKYKGASHCDDKHRNESSHLTNYAINKKSLQFKEGKSKRLLSTTLHQLAKKYPKQFDIGKFWQQMEQIVKRILLAIAPSLLSELFGIQSLSEGVKFGNQNANLAGVDSNKASAGGSSSSSSSSSPDVTFNHVIGIDILLDQNFKPWLLELNATPSLSIEKIVPLPPELLKMMRERDKEMGSYGSSPYRNVEKIKTADMSLGLGGGHLHTRADVRDNRNLASPHHAVIAARGGGQSGSLPSSGMNNAPNKDSASSCSTASGTSGSSSSSATGATSRAKQLSNVRAKIAGASSRPQQTVKVGGAKGGPRAQDERVESDGAEEHVSSETASTGDHEECVYELEVEQEDATSATKTIQKPPHPVGESETSRGTTSANGRATAKSSSPSIVSRLMEDTETRRPRRSRVDHVNALMMNAKKPPMTALYYPEETDSNINGSGSPASASSCTGTTPSGTAPPPEAPGAAGTPATPNGTTPSRDDRILKRHSTRDFQQSQARSYISDIFQQDKTDSYYRNSPGGPGNTNHYGSGYGTNNNNIWGNSYSSSSSSSLNSPSRKRTFGTNMICQCADMPSCPHFHIESEVDIRAKYGPIKTLLTDFSKTVHDPSSCFFMPNSAILANSVVQSLCLESRKDDIKKDSELPGAAAAWALVNERESGGGDDKGKMMSSQPKIWVNRRGEVTLELGEKGQAEGAGRKGSKGNSAKASSDRDRLQKVNMGGDYGEDDSYCPDVHDGGEIATESRLKKNPITSAPPGTSSVATVSNNYVEAQAVSSSTTSGTTSSTTTNGNGIKLRPHISEKGVCLRLNGLPNFMVTRHLPELQKILQQNEAFRSNQTAEPCQCPIILDVCSRSAEHAESYLKLYRLFRKIAELYVEMMLNSSSSEKNRRQPTWSFQGPNSREERKREQETKRLAAAAAAAGERDHQAAAGGEKVDQQNVAVRLTLSEAQKRVQQLVRVEGKLFQKYHQMNFDTLMKGLEKLRRELYDASSFLHPFPRGAGAREKSGDDLHLHKNTINTRLVDDTLGGGVSLLIVGLTALAQGGFNYYEDYDLSLGILSLIQKIKTTAY